MIAIFDEDGGGDVDFQEFVSGLSAFSSKGNKEQKLRFAFKVYDIDRDGYISNGELFIVLKMMVGSNLRDQQLQQIVDKTIMEADLDKDGKISFEEFTRMVENTDISMSMTLGTFAPLWTFFQSCATRFMNPDLTKPQINSRFSAYTHGTGTVMNTLFTTVSASMQDVKVFPVSVSQPASSGVQLGGRPSQCRTCDTKQMSSHRIGHNASRCRPASSIS